MMSWLIKGKEVLTFRNDSRFVALPYYNEPLRHFIVKVMIVPDPIQCS